MGRSCFAWVSVEHENTTANTPGALRNPVYRRQARGGHSAQPIVVTGWALPNHTDRPDGGAKSTHLAVPAGAVYYFEAEPDANQGPGNAIALANALNWHGDSKGTEIKNRRSTLMGEKGFGLGVCGTWGFWKPGKA